MFKKVNIEKYILLLRYGYIFAYIIALGSTATAVTPLNIFLLLVFIINNQIRYFLFPKDKVYLHIISLSVEILLCLVLSTIAGNYGTLILIPALVDLLFNYNSVFSAIYIIAAFIFIVLNGSLQLSLVFLISAFPVFVLMRKTNDIEGRKITAQELYDKLREQEEELKTANKELEAYASTVEEITVLRERNRISREIHDNVGHALSTIIIQLGAIEKVCTINQEQAAEMARNLAVFAKDSMENVRAAVRAMKPRELEEYEGVISISEMIKNFKKLTGIDVVLNVSKNIWKLNSDQTMVIYRIIQEFLSNAIRHGKASQVKIFMNFSDDGLRIHLKDNGIGCTDIVPGFGLSGIKDRVSVWGGTIEYFSEPGKGFELVVTMDKVKLSVDGV